MKRRFSKGFTLLELLVVISIIGILVAMGAFAFSNAQKKGRNARRLGDLKAMQNAYEQYYAKMGSYDTSSTMASGVTFTVPTDPINTSPYQYQETNFTAASYCVCATLECTSGTDCTAGNSTAPDCSAYASSGNNRPYFCVNQLQ